ncbi:Gfo/Idh/MocA family protein [Saccharothrix coeruleofusca]|uniref:Gfo/Idh/MocA family protein n=1 Tax=Saccharothrix coeruleofusca TaxID=33919 RepID=UPI00166FBC45|nr:Gfo/Idh/MocA family oxidoreductase [Saccharothrix coeruleofusca]
MRWGFIGAGGIAQNSLGPAVHAARGAVLRASSSRSPVRAAALKPEVVHDDYLSLLNDPTVDVVYIALHNSAHEEWVLRSLRAGKHVVCEKPLGLNAAEVARMVDAARRSGRLLVEAYWNQWHPRFRELARIVRDGELGEIRSVRARFRGAQPAAGDYRTDPTLGGGALYDVGCYAIAATLTAFGGREPLEVTAEQETTDRGVDAVTRAVLRFDTGSAFVEACLRGDRDEELLIKGDSGEVEFTYPVFTAKDQVSLLLRSAQRESISTFPPVDPYRLMVEEVSAAARGEDSFAFPVESSLLVARVMDAVRAAAIGTSASSGSGADDSISLSGPDLNSANFS